MMASSQHLPIEVQFSGQDILLQLPDIKLKPIILRVLNVNRLDNFGCCFSIFYKATLVTWNAAKCIGIAVLDPGSVFDDHIIRTNYLEPAG